MELDTGANVSGMAGRLFHKSFSNLAVKCLQARMRSCCGALDPVQGKTQVRVCYDDKEAALPSILVHGASPTLLNRTWIHALGVRLPQPEVAEIHY